MYDWTCDDCDTTRPSAFFASVHANAYGHTMARADDPTVFVTANDPAYA